MSQAKGMAAQGSPRAPAATAPEAPRSASLPSQAVSSDPSTLMGRMRPAVAGALIAATLVSGPMAQGADLGAPPPPAEPTRVELALPELAQPAFPTDTLVVRAPTRGEQVFAQLARDLDLAMQVTARDMADPATRFIEGAPGYKEIPANELRRLVVRALEQVPLGELAGGTVLAEWIQSLPNMGHLDVAKMSWDELSRAAPRAQREAIKERFLPLIEGHEVEAAALAFAVVTGVRAASPEAAALMDRLRPRIDIWRTRSDDGDLSARARLAWRDARVLPDLDLEGGARRTVGEVTYRATITGTVAPERDPILTGTATVGATWARGGVVADSSASYVSGPTSHTRADLLVGYQSPDSPWIVSAHLSGLFGEGQAIGGASGRVGLDIDASREVRLEGGARGSFGLYGGVGADSDGRNSDLRAGMVFRLRW